MKIQKDLQKLKALRQELEDELDRLKVSYGIPKSGIEIAKGEIRQAINKIKGIEGSRKKMNPDDIHKMVGIFEQMAAGKHKIAVFQVTEDGTRIIDQITKTTIRMK